MKKLTITICAIITLATYQYASAALFVDYTIDTDAAVGDQGLFTIKDLDFSGVPSIIANDASPSQKSTISFILGATKSLNFTTLDNAVDRLKVIIGGVTFLKVNSLGELLMKTTNEYKISNKQLVNIDNLLNEDLLSFDNQDSGSSKVAFKKGDNVLSFEAKVDTNEIAYKTTGDVGSSLTFNTTDLITPNGVNFTVNKTKLNIFGKLNIGGNLIVNTNAYVNQGGEVIADNLEIMDGGLRLGSQVCVKSNGSSISFYESDCSTLKPLRTDNLKVNPLSVADTSSNKFITKNYADSKASKINFADDNFGVYYIENFCEAGSTDALPDCEILWANMTLNAHSPL